MKKIFFTALLLLPFLCNAQSNNASEIKTKNYFPEAGDWAVGISASPFLSYLGNFFSSDYTFTPSFSSSNPGSIFGKFQLDESRSLRFEAMIGFSSNTDYSGSVSSSGEYNQYRTNALSIGLSAGIEKYKSIHERIRGYYGADAGLYKYSYDGNRYMSSLLASGSASYKDATDSSNDFKETGGNEFSLVLKGFVGLEYFVLPRVAVSGEFGFYLQPWLRTDRIYKPSAGEDVVYDPKEYGMDFGTNSSSMINLILYF